MKEIFIHVKGHKTRYLMSGEGNVSILLLHGLGMSADYWKYNFENLSQFSCVYAPDLIGFGKTEKPRIRYTFECHIQFIKDFIQALQLKNLVIIGHCLGGAIGLKLVLDYEEQVKKLVLVNSPCFCQDITFLLRLLTIPGLRHVLLQFASHYLTRMIFKFNFYDQSKIPEDFYTLLFDQLKQPDIRYACLSTIYESLSLYGVRKEVLESTQGLSKIRIPILLLYADQDRIVPLSQFKIAQEKMVTAETHLFKQCGHLPQIEQPRLFNELVSRFIKNVIPNEMVF